MSESSCDAPAPSAYTVRPFVPADAASVTGLIELVYGDTYYPRDLYDPGEIVLRNAAGTLVSVLALDAADQVIGHYALERPQLGAVADMQAASGTGSGKHAGRE